MAIITRAYSEIDGQIAEASSVNKVINDLYTLQAGNIDGSNIMASGVIAGNVQTSAIITRTINNQAVSTEKLDYSYSVAAQVWS